jgi:hypothetical protein
MKHMNQKASVAATGIPAWPLCMLIFAPQTRNILAIIARMRFFSAREGF